VALRARCAAAGTDSGALQPRSALSIRTAVPLVDSVVVMGVAPSLMMDLHNE
jgi:hypothetical protein